MKNKIIFIILTVIILTLSSIIIAERVNAYAKNQYWECTSKGEKSLGDAFGRRAGTVCKDTCCKLCISTKPFQDCFSSSAKPSCSCQAGGGGGGGGGTDLNPPTITINTPVNGTAYPSKSTTIDIDLNEAADLFVSDNSGSFQKLCSKCTTYTGVKIYNDGKHSLMFKATDSNQNTKTTSLNIIIDTQIPKVNKILPLPNSFSNGEFTINYNEDNLKDLILNYKSSSNPIQSVSKKDCPSGRSQQCTIKVNNLPQGETEFFFTLKDAVNSINSKSIKIKVDTVAPQLTVRDPKNKDYGSTKALFDISSSELVLLNYIDMNEHTPKPKQLCSSCSNINKLVTFKDGLHNVTIKGKDKAGNQASFNILFTTDSKKPLILRTFPLKTDLAINGNFKVIYTEENLKSMSLFYGTSVFFEVSLTNCQSGKNMECSKFIDISSLNGKQIQYFFKITDKSGTSVASNPVTLMADTSVPNMNIQSPLEANTYPKNTRIRVSLSEKVKVLEYILDNSNTGSLCHNCNSFNSTKTIPAGNHKIKIIATDYANNKAEKTVNFKTA